MKQNGIIAFICVCILTFIDQIVKLLINANMTLGDSYSLIDGVFAITYVQNKGAAWGSFSGMRIFLLVLTITIVTGAIFLYIKMLSKNILKPLRICTIFLISGAIGNIIDRLIHGYVIDMFDFNLIDFPVFNVADIYVTCSMIVLMLLILFKYNDKDFEPLFKRSEKA